MARRRDKNELRKKLNEISTDYSAAFERKNEPAMQQLESEMRELSTNLMVINCAERLSSGTG